MDKKLFFFILILSFMFFSSNSYAISVDYSNSLSSPEIISVSTASNKVVVRCAVNGNFNSVVGVFFFKKTPSGYSKLTAYDMELKKKSSYQKSVSFTHTVSSTGTYAIICGEFYDQNGDKRFSASEMSFSKKEMIDVNTATINKRFKTSINYFKFNSDNSVTIYCNLFGTSSLHNVKSYLNVNGKDILLELDKLFGPETPGSVRTSNAGFLKIKTSPYTVILYALKYYPSYSGTHKFYCKFVSSDGRTFKTSTKEVYVPEPYKSSNDNNNNYDNNNGDNDNNNGDNTFESVDLYSSVSPKNPSDGRVYFECRASGNEDFSKGSFYFVSGEETVLLEKGKSSDHYVVYSTGTENSYSGYYRYLEKGYYYPYCKYISSSGKVYSTDIEEVVYE